MTSSKIYHHANCRLQTQMPTAILLISPSKNFDELTWDSNEIADCNVPPEQLEQYLRWTKEAMND